MDAIDAVKAYLKGAVAKPFLVAFDAAADLKALRDAFPSCETVRVSEFCVVSEAYPDIDGLCGRLAGMKGAAILLGVGEYAALVDDEDILRRFLDFTLDGLRLVVPVWRGHGFIAREEKNDPRIKGRRTAAFPAFGIHWSVRVFKKGLLGKVDAHGFKMILQRLESGCESSLSAETEVRPLNRNWCRLVDTAYEVYKERNPQSSIPSGMFSEEQWKMFLDEKRSPDESLTSADTLRRFLEQGVDGDPYLAYVASRTARYADWRHNLLSAILNVSPEDANFMPLYMARKKLLSQFAAVDVTEFLREARGIVPEPVRRIRHLTDATALERDEIVRAVAEIGEMPAAVETVYPALWEYAREFSFSCGEISGTLTQYFRDYKRQKVLGRIEPQFMETVRELANDRPQFLLPTRESVLESIGAKNAALCWVDALGCEFLGFIQTEARRLGMKIKVTAARAKLPTLTSVNRAFYDEWPGEKMQKMSRLDEIKHGDFDVVHEDGVAAHVSHELPHELEAMEKTMESIVAWLRTRASGKVVLTSDHGATRLAVIAESETVWEMPEKGKHGGRCCRKSEFDGELELPPCSTESDDEEWHVLAGYDRFKGGRKGDVEVHGGATIEEMVVPVVELELMDRDIRVRPVKDVLKVTFRDKEVTLAFLCSATLSSPALEFGGVRHCAKADGDGGRYVARVPKPMAGKHVAQVYDGDSCVGEVRFTVESGGVQIKNDFF